MTNLLNFKSFFKFLGKNKFYTAIDIFGLSVSLMFVVIIAVYTVQELSTDNFQAKKDRIYVVSNESYLGSAYRLAAHLQNRYPEIEQVCPTVTHFDNMTPYVGETKTNATLMFTDTTFFDMFSFPLIQGDPHRVLEAKNYAVISESYANRVFIDRDPMGQMIKLNDSVNVMVNGIMKDIRNSAIPYADILSRIDNVGYFNPALDTEEFNNAGGCLLFVLVGKGADLTAKKDDMLEYLKEVFWIYRQGIAKQVVLTPLKDVYFSTINSYNLLNQGDWKFVMILMSVGILILIFAIINYINLTVAQTGFRAKEMATRRLLGSSRGELFSRLILESTLLSFISFLLGFLFALALIPIANDLLKTDINLLSAVTPFSILMAVLLILLLGLVAGLLPAIIISNSKPIDVVRGSFRTKTKMVFGKVFITFQNVITIMLIAASITMVYQINHLINAPLGYNKTNILYISPFQLENKEQINTFTNEISQLASVKQVAYSQGTPFDRGNNWTVDYETHNVSFQIFVADTVFMNMLGLEILKENNLAANEGYYLTEQAIKETNNTFESEKFKLGDDRNIPIAGILRDFQLGNITNDLKPILIQKRKREDFYPWSLLVEVSGNNPFDTREQIKEIFERISKTDFDGRFVDQQIEESFESQKRTSKIVMIFCGIAILISLLGLVAMSTYFIQQRSREIAVRKVFGSSDRQVLVRLVGTFLNYVGVAFILATPVVWYIMRRWLSDYSYRISLSPWIFIAAGVFCLLISFFAVYWQSRRAAHRNPVDSVKSE